MQYVRAKARKVSRLNKDYNDSKSHITFTNARVYLLVILSIFGKSLSLLSLQNQGDETELVIHARTRMRVVAIFTPSQHRATGGAEHHSSTQLISRNR